MSVAYLITLAETSFSISIILCRRGRRRRGGMSRVREQFVIRRKRFNVSVALTSVFLLVACLPKVSLDTARHCTHTHTQTETHVHSHAEGNPRRLLRRSYANSPRPYAYRAFPRGNLIPSLSWLTWHGKKGAEFISKKWDVFGGFDKRGGGKGSAQGSRS